MNDRKYWCAHLSNYMVLLCEIIQLKFDFRKEYRQQTIQNFSKLSENWIRNMIRLNWWYSITTNKIKYRKESKGIFSQLIYIYMNRTKGVVHRGEEKVARFSIVGGYDFTFYRKLASCLRIYDEIFYEAKFPGLSFPMNYARFSLLHHSLPSNIPNYFKAFK